MSRTRLLVLVLLVAAIAAFVSFDLGRFLSLDYLKSQQAVLVAIVEREPVVATAIFFGVYVLTTALSLPGAALLTLVAGALFGLGWGLVVVSFASTLGATLVLSRTRTEVLQVNLGKRCNQACHHCHVDAGPKRTEMMSGATAERIIGLLARSPSVRTVDLTGGVPELMKMSSKTSQPSATRA